MTRRLELLVLALGAPCARTCSLELGLLFGLALDHDEPRHLAGLGSCGRALVALDADSVPACNPVGVWNPMVLGGDDSRHAGASAAALLASFPASLAFSTQYSHMPISLYTASNVAFLY